MNLVKEFIDADRKTKFGFLFNMFCLSMAIVTIGLLVWDIV